MDVKFFDSLSRRDFDNGAILDDIRKALRELEGANEEIARLKRDMGELRGSCAAYRDAIEHWRVERDRLRVENVRLLQELHDPDSPEGKTYRSEVTRLEGEIDVLQVSNRDYLLELEDARNETRAIEYLRKEAEAECDAVRTRMGRLRKRLEIISESPCGFQPERHPGCICNSCTARRELEGDGRELEEAQQERGSSGTKTDKEDDLQG